LWNGGIGYKLLKKKQLELRVSVFDILNNNNSITRNVTESYIEDVKSNVLNRYYMMTLTYNLRNFGTKAPETRETKPEEHGPH
jgi:vacuolar-type H+-ATPase subunit D/Vma8